MDRTALSVSDRWVREGRHLREWLPDLISGTPLTRRLAENAISAMYWGAPVADATALFHAPKELRTHMEEWGQAVTEVINAPDFPGVEYVKAALAMVKRDRDEARTCCAIELEVQWLEGDHCGSDPPDAIKQYRSRVNTGRLANSLGTHTLVVVLRQAGAVLLRLDGLVRQSLHDPDLRDVVTKAMESIGPKAAEFLPDLLENAEVPSTTIAAVGHDDVSTIEYLRDALVLSPPDASSSAYNALIAIGPRAVELVPGIVDELIAKSREAGQERLLFVAAHLAPNRRDIFERLLAIAADTTRDMHPIPNFPEHAYDRNAPKRGEAIRALGLFRTFAVDAIGTIVAAIDNFEEYDPDETYDMGDHGRAIEALRALFGFRYRDTSPPALSAEIASALIPHLPLLISHIHDSGPDGGIDSNIIWLLGQLGPMAGDAIPVLEPLDDSDEEFDLVGTDAAVLDPVKFALYRLRTRETGPH